MPRVATTTGRPGITTATGDSLQRQYLHRAGSSRLSHSGERNRRALARSATSVRAVVRTRSRPVGAKTTGGVERSGDHQRLVRTARGLSSDRSRCVTLKISPI